MRKVAVIGVRYDQVQRQANKTAVELFTEAAADAIT